MAFACKSSQHSKISAMPEPLFVIARAKLSATAFEQWLASPAPLSGSDNEPQLPSRAKQATVLDVLAAHLAAKCVPATRNHMLCRYDNALAELQFAAYLCDTPDSKAMASRLATLVSSITTIIGGQGEFYCVVTDLARISEFNSPPWFIEWIDALPTLDVPEKQFEWIDTAIRRSLRPSFPVANSYAARLTAIGWLYTDGELVYARRGL